MKQSKLGARVAGSAAAVRIPGVAGAVVVALATGAGTSHARSTPSPAVPAGLASAAQVAETFVETAVRRVHTSRSYDLVTNALRQGQTRAQWARGDIAVIPIPDARIEHARLIVYQPPSRPVHIAWLTVISGRQEGVASSWSFRIDLLERRGGWRVDYWEPAPEVAWLAAPVAPPHHRHPRARRATGGPCCLEALLAVSP